MTIRTRSGCRDALRGLARNLAKRAEAARLAAEADLDETARQALAVAVERAPRDSGVLAASAYLRVERAGERTVARIGFSAPHARAQHERPELNHPGGGQAYFLETALEEAAAGFLARNANRR